MQFFDTKVHPSAIAQATEVLESGWLSEGKKVVEFEVALSDRLGLKNPVTLNSGTAALHLALAVAGLGPGDEVILPPQTFIATGLAIIMQGATPVFADIQPDTGNLDPDDVQRHVTEHTKAIIPVHWAGYPCDMDEINRLASIHNLVVVEDAAHALGARYKGCPIGTLSRFTAFSFQAIKHMTTGDGGVLCCLADEDYQDARTRRWFGIDRHNAKPSILGEREFDVTKVGFKYHMNDLAAAIGLGNLEGLDESLERRRIIGFRYREELAGVPGLSLLRADQDREHAYWLFTICVTRREDFILAIKARQIPSSVVHQRIDRYQIFGGAKLDLAGQAKFDATQVSLPLHAGLTDEDVQRVIDAVQAGW